MKTKTKFSPAVTVIILFGLISLLGDAVYEGARSANSQYFNLLKVSATQVGIVFGIGEFIGYALRLVAGIFSDKTKRYWLFIFLGYGMLVAVPLMGFTMNWNILIILILMERIGKALRNPSKDTIISAVAQNQVGVGFAFGLQEALDQIGALVGPLIFTIVFFIAESNELTQYQLGYKALIIPFMLLMIFLIFAYKKIEKENLIKEIHAKEYKEEKLQPTFWIYTFFTFFATLGFLNFSVIGYHLKAEGIFSDGNITLLYALAMGIDAITALLFGKIYDNMKLKTGIKTSGLLTLLVIPFLSVALPIFTLSNSEGLVIAGMVVFGIIMGVHETIMRSAIADIVPFYKRGTGYGVFNTAYGLALLGGSSLMGFLYDKDMTSTIIILAILFEMIALLLYYKMNKMVKINN
ncbi:MAG TPA: MFS transporter [Soehngenia sp.]|nr:MFS transporter [Soehngenia sp.]HPP31283.1 MFS transporter [Soehngenia sp.]